MPDSVVRLEATASPEATSIAMFKDPAGGLIGPVENR
jgi:hypothetical protein